MASQEFLAEEWRNYAQKIQQQAKAQLEARDRVIERIEQENKGLLDRVEKLTDKLWEVMQRPPVIVKGPDTAEIIGQLGETLAKVLGYQPEAPDKGLAVTATAMEDHGLDASTGMAGEKWYPDVEFDAWLAETGDAPPERAGWVNRQTNATTPPLEGQHPVHQVAGNKVVRMDGQPLFRAGEGAPQPQGGVE